MSRRKNKKLTKEQLCMRPIGFHRYALPKKRTSNIDVSELSDDQIKSALNNLGNSKSEMREALETEQEWRNTLSQAERDLVRLNRK
jgi:hypothetical protein